MRKLISKITDSGWFRFVCFVCCVVVSVVVHNRFFPTEDPLRHTLEIRATQTSAGPSATARTEVLGVRVVWDFLNQEVSLENANGATAKVLLGDDFSEIVLAPRQKLIKKGNIVIGKETMIEVRVTGTSTIEREYYVLGSRGVQSTEFTQNP